VLSKGKVRPLHQQNELNNGLSLNWKRNEKLSTLAVGEAVVSKPMQNTNCGKIGVKNTNLFQS